jgi:hypothetical protein
MHTDAAAARTHVAGRGFDFEFLILRARVMFHGSLLLPCQPRESRFIPSAAPIVDDGDLSMHRMTDGCKRKIAIRYPMYRVRR